MNTPEPSFEVLHLVSTVLVRFNTVFKKCELDVQQIYVMAYIKSHGKDTRYGQKIMLRATITRVLKEVFNCNDNQVSIWVNKLCSNKYLGEVTLDKEEKAELFSTREGRNKALVITKSGLAKVSSFVEELEKLRHEITQGRAEILRPPGVEFHGPIASALLFFLSQFPSSNE